MDRRNRRFISKIMRVDRQKMVRVSFVIMATLDQPSVAQVDASVTVDHVDASVTVDQVDASVNTAQVDAAHPSSNAIDFYHALLDCYERSREMTLALCQSDGSIIEAYCHIRVLVGHTQWQNTRLMVYRPNYPLPVLYSKIASLTTKRMVIKGAMIYKRSDRYDKYCMTIEPADDHPLVFDIRLEITGYTTMYLTVAPEQRPCIVRERMFLPFDRARHMVVADQHILYNHSMFAFKHMMAQPDHERQDDDDHGERIVIQSESVSRQVPSRDCLVVFQLEPAERRKLVGPMCIATDMEFSDSESSLSESELVEAMEDQLDVA